MAAAADVTAVRENTNEPTTETYSDEYIGALVDAGTVASASATIWKRKAAAYSELVDVSEAGASRKMSDLMTNALKMQKVYEDAVLAETGSSVTGRAKTHSIVRT